MRTALSRIDFHRTKYGREILIDIAWIHEMPTFLHAEPHWLSFFDITLITRGRGWFWLDGHRYRVTPGQVLFTTPGQVRSWDVSGLDGLCLFFPAAFLEEFFSDTDFLHRLPYFHVTSAAAAVRLAPTARTRLRAQLARMRSELRAWRPDSTHVLRARLYEVLVRLSRAYAKAYGTEPDRRAHPTVLKFRQLVDRGEGSGHALARMAADIGVSRAHLTRLCRQQLGMTAKEVMQQRVEIAARRLLLFSELTSAQIATTLGFADASYFTRFFKRRTGMTPSTFRAHARRET